MSKFLNSTGVVFGGDFIRQLTLSCLVISPLLLGVPLQIIQITDMANTEKDMGSSFVFWPGWTVIHTDWDPNSLDTSEWTKFGFWYKFQHRFAEWMNPLCASYLFAIYDLTEDACECYRSLFWRAAEFLGFQSKPSESPIMSAIVFRYTPILASDE